MFDPTIPCTYYVYQDNVEFIDGELQPTSRLMGITRHPAEALTLYYRCTEGQGRIFAQQLDDRNTYHWLDYHGVVTLRHHVDCQLRRAMQELKYHDEKYSDSPI